ncbi:MAG: hypothetical protein EPN65_16545 [Pandoraea sp.]|uniref:hypothetical protein n=1 Tax=Pandoraea sp. TaxID=1883445 RepID=UPI0012041C5C|nr:hypothetical protein [Pandoraea sp.]TAM15923.1 MAG: hypothetical protein EPN65_16545 [Pandoraea sp.]
MNPNIDYFDILRIVHEEAGLTLSREDFNLCVRIAKRAAAAGDARASEFSIVEVPRADWEHPGWREFDVVYRGLRGERRVHGAMIKVVARMNDEDDDYALGEKVRDWILSLGGTESTSTTRGVGLQDDQRQAVTRALHAARGFIANGVALGYIRMPDEDCPDPAHQTPKLIDDAIAALGNAAP